MIRRVAPVKVSDKDKTEMDVFIGGFRPLAGATLRKHLSKGSKQ